MKAGQPRRRRVRGLALVLTIGTLACGAVSTGIAGAAPAASAHAARAAGSAARAAFGGSAAARVVCQSKAHPKLATRLTTGITAALRGRRSVVGLAVADAGLDVTCKVNQGSHFDAASVIKVTIISALLRKVGGHAHMTAAQRSLAWAMITQSNNSAATKLWNEVGMHSMQRFLDLAKMTHTRLSDAWGLTQLTAADELTLLRLLSAKGTVLTTASRRYVLWLMAHVVPSQRWGVSAGAPGGVTVHIKNGWLPYPTGSNWHINSLGVFTGRGISYQVAALSSANPSMAYGIATIEAASRVINRDLDWK